MPTLALGQTNALPLASQPMSPTQRASIPSQQRAAAPAQFQSSGFFILRTPLLPVDELLALGEGLEAAGARSPELTAALERDRARVRARLQAAMAQPALREAIFLASPSLEGSIDSWLQDAQCERGQRTERALVRYFARMSGRPTLFGLFAGYSVGRIGAATNLELGSRAHYRRHTCLDAGYLAALADRLIHDDAARLGAQVRYHKNTSLHRAPGQQLAYVRPLPSGPSRSYQMICEAAPQAVDAALAILDAHAEGLTAGALAAALTADGVARADALVRELIARRILLPALAPPVTGAAPLAALVAQLQAGGPGAAPAAERLAKIGSALTAIDAAGVGTPVHKYQQLTEELGRLPVPLDPSHLFYVDLNKPAPDAALGPELLDQIVAGAALLERLCAADPEGDGGAELAIFRAEFQRRYEDREVPLTTALDEQCGVAFPTAGAPSAEPLPLLADLHFAASEGSDSAAWGRRQQLLLGKLEEALRSGAQEVALVPAELDALCAQAGQGGRPLPDAFAVTATVLGAADRAAPRVYISSITGPSGASKLGRFCHGDAELRERVEQHLRAEEALRPDAIFAELAHLPEGPMGTVISRPQLRAYEIPYLGQSGAPLEQQIPISDLMVSVRGDRVVLRSARLQREVLPRLTSPHNYSNGCNLRLYRFLGALQAQGVQRSARFSWGALEGAAFLPRLVCGQLILSLAQWRLSRAQLAALTVEDEGARFAAVQELRQQLRLPRWVALMDRDNLLPIDLDNVLSIESALALLKESAQATLVELLEVSGMGARREKELCVRGPEGRYLHQVVVPLLRTRSILPEAAPATPEVEAARLPRSFAPGSEWLYVKVYTGKGCADSVLLSALQPAMQEALASGAAQGWFFIRYGDPDWHLRLRVHGAPQRLLGEVLPALHRALAALMADGSVWRVQLDTYERECERYGGAVGMPLSEQLFQADSEAAAGLLAALPAVDREETRWQWTLLGIDRLLDDLGLDFETKWAVISHARERFGEELKVDALFQRELGARFRVERAGLESLRAGKGAAAAAMAVLERRSRRLAPVAAALHRAEQSGQLGTLVAVLAVSYIHMHANRMLRSAARAQELVIYDFLERLYQSESARARRSAPRQVARSQQQFEGASCP